VLHGRKRTATVVATLIALLTALVTVGIGLAGPQTASAKPDLKTVKKQVEKLDHEAEIASERYNEAKVKVAAIRTTMSALKADLARQQKVVDQMRDQVAEMVVEQYQGSALSTTSQVVLSNNPDAFLDNLNAVSSYYNQRGEVMADYSTQLERLELRKKAVAAESRRLTRLAKQMAAEKAAIDDKAARTQALLDRLESRQRAAFVRTYAQSSGRDYSGPLPKVEASGRAAAAVKYALAQVGKSYVYGAAGPNAFDCSGLTMRAWGAAGVALPHSSNAQQSSGMRVSESELIPGDLVFYYSPVSHVGIYIGDGLIVDAQNPRSGVKVSRLHSMPYSGAVRPG